MARKIMTLTLITLLVIFSHLHVVIHWTTFCSDRSGFLYSNVLFLETGFYCGFDGIICFTIRSTNFSKKSYAKMNTTKTAKKNLFCSRYKIDPVTPQPASEIQYQLFMAEFTRKVNSANSVCGRHFRGLFSLVSGYGVLEVIVTDD